MIDARLNFCAETSCKNQFFQAVIDLGKQTSCEWVVYVSISLGFRLDITFYGYDNASRLKFQLYVSNKGYNVDSFVVNIFVFFLIISCFFYIISCMLIFLSLSCC